MFHSGYSAEATGDFLLKLGHADVAFGQDEEKQSNEIKTAILLLNAIDIAGTTITADALLTQHEPADHLVKPRNAHYHFTVKGNPKNLLEDIAPHFDCCERAPNFTNTDAADHGRIETRKIWLRSGLNAYLNFPQAGQASKIEGIGVHKKSGHCSREIASGITRRTKHQATPNQVLQDNRNCPGPSKTVATTSSTGITMKTAAASAKAMDRKIPHALRRFAVSIIKSRKVRSVAQKMRERTFNLRLVFDYLRMTTNTCAGTRT